MKPKRGRPKGEPTKVISFRVTTKITKEQVAAVQRFINSIISL